MTDLISRQEAIDAVEESRRFNCHQGIKTASAHEYEHRHFLKILRDLPSAYPKKGKWIDEGQADDFFPHHSWRCSECGERVLEIGVPWYKYCPNCGADTKEKEDG